MILFRADVFSFLRYQGIRKNNTAHAFAKSCGAKVFEIYANETDFNIDFEKNNFDIFLVEDIHNIRGTAKYQNLCAIVRNYPEKRLVFTTRGTIGSYGGAVLVML